MKKFSLLTLSAMAAFMPVAALACGGDGPYDPYTSYVQIRGVYTPVRHFSRRILSGQRQAPPMPEAMMSVPTF